MLYVYLKYSCKYCVKFSPNYVFTICGKCVNLKTNREIKQISKGGSIGYVLGGKFYSLTFLRTQLEKITKKEKLSF